MELRVPGDKSLTQRALILAALADGESRLSGLLHGGDAASTAEALSSLGAGVPLPPPDGSPIRVRGVGLRGLRTPTRPAPVDLGNSGTGVRLLAGVLAGHDLSVTLTGDASLRRRPMERITRPLVAMGARVTHAGEGGRLPMTVTGRRDGLHAIQWSSPVASAQVKSAILLAGLTGGAAVQVVEPERSRDHTERMLRACGVSVLGHAGEGGWRVELRDPPERLGPLEFRVPGDLSSAAFFLALAAVGGVEDELTLRDVGLNPTRSAFLDVLRRMGADIRAESPNGPAGESSSGGIGEPVGDVRAVPGNLVGTDVGGAEVPAMIDELPLVAVLGARARGVTRVSGAAELRHKESDRIRALVDNLRGLGVEVEERADGFELEGSEVPLRGRIRTHGDHRIAMAFGVLGRAPGNRIEVDDPGCADVSYPGFWGELDRLAGPEQRT